MASPLDRLTRFFTEPTQLDPASGKGQTQSKVNQQQRRNRELLEGEQNKRANRKLIDETARYPKQPKPEYKVDSDEVNRQLESSPNVGQDQYGDKVYNPYATNEGDSIKTQLMDKAIETGYVDPDSPIARTVGSQKPIEQEGAQDDLVMPEGLELPEQPTEEEPQPQGEGLLAEGQVDDDPSVSKINDMEEAHENKVRRAFNEFRKSGMTPEQVAKFYEEQGITDTADIVSQYEEFLREGLGFNITDPNSIKGLPFNTEEGSNYHPDIEEEDQAAVDAALAHFRETEDDEPIQSLAYSMALKYGGDPNLSYEEFKEQNRKEVSDNMTEEQVTKAGEDAFVEGGGSKEAWKGKSLTDKIDFIAGLGVTALASSLGFGVVPSLVFGLFGGMSSRQGDLAAQQQQSNKDRDFYMRLARDGLRIGKDGNPEIDPDSPVHSKGMQSLGDGMIYNPNTNEMKFIHPTQGLVHLDSEGNVISKSDPETAGLLSEAMAARNTSGQRAAEKRSREIKEDKGEIYAPSRHDPIIETELASEGHWEDAYNNSSDTGREKIKKHIGSQAFEILSEANRNEAYVDTFGRMQPLEAIRLALANNKSLGYYEDVSLFGNKSGKIDKGRAAPNPTADDVIFNILNREAEKNQILANADNAFESVRNGTSYLQYQHPATGEIHTVDYREALTMQGADEESIKRGIIKKSIRVIPATEV
ncbi:hypothetical protein [Vibrio sp. CyArs1]|uniref:hypothetical protein n=1 Tax=Vibrio sp. CyArs1 TaxID=2682577 RepID=UPI001F05E180|nr:hypothetical protein [Vibrio sp. CyArs1]